VTAGTDRAQEVKHGGGTALQSYLTSLLYLREEAKRDGLDAVAGIMWDALAAIERWLETGNAPARSRDVLDSSLCHGLDFLLKWLALPPDRQRQVARDIGRYEGGLSAEAVPRSRPRASKRIAG
jgi:hypothetical protein